MTGYIEIPEDCAIEFAIVWNGIPDREVRAEMRAWFLKWFKESKSKKHFGD